METEVLFCSLQTQKESHIDKKKERKMFPKG